MFWYTSTRKLETKLMNSIDDEFAGFDYINRLWHMKNKGVQHLPTSSQNPEAIDI